MSENFSNRSELPECRTRRLIDDSGLETALPCPAKGLTEIVVFEEAVLTANCIYRNITDYTPVIMKNEIVHIRLVV